MHDLDSILAALATNTWPAEHHGRALAAAALSLAAYEGRVRDQGTPYIEHPLAVVAILRDELHISHPETLIFGLLHDALEVTPSSEPEIAIRLGCSFVAELRAMTPDHRLEGRSRQATDETVWRTKTRRLSSAQTESPELKAAYEVLLGERDRYRTSGMALT
ncbi:HD domain-containing protein [Nonomuraea sp. B19D2]|uniref:HD domain-containing protein n=1 Tax=Nonomuraea sp. B19D2 TaxID=3159561 RepID=UPI0032DB1884